MIVFNSISQAFGKKSLFKDISLSLNRGEKIGLVGPNGAGKTTLFRIILNETEASAGTAGCAHRVFAAGSKIFIRPYRA
jgi:ATPase subunit of ABC transporter with duplicated ATPase domains